MREFNLIASVFIVTYLIFSFASMELNAINWEMGMRVIYVIIAGAISILLIINEDG